MAVSTERQINSPAPTLSWLWTQRDEIMQLAERYKASNLRVFGSVARGEAMPDSDIDLLATFREGISVLDMVGFWLDLQELLGHEVSLIADDIPDEPFMRNALEDAVAL